VRAALGLGLALCCLVTLGCGDARQRAIVVRVGDAGIDKRTVDHWTSTIAHGAIVANMADPRWPPRRQALALLIYSHWLIGEAARVGLRPSSWQLERKVAEQERSMPNGHDEFNELLAASGETTADVEFEARARWAAGTLAARLNAEAGRQARARATGAAVARFYHEHASRWQLRERRYYDLIERIPSRRKALALAKRLRSGAGFAGKSSKERPFRPRTFAGLHRQGVVYRAVFHAKVGVLTGPLPLQGAYALFVLRRIEPAHLEGLPKVRDAIKRQLLGSAEREARARLIAEFHRRWIARTFCHAGYVVQKCAQFTGPRAPERDPLSAF
jgi:hypothetical protein